MKLLTFFAAMMLLAPSLSAQDPNFSQPMAAPLYYNPAFAGTAHLARLSGVYHDHWSSISSGNKTFNLGYDQHIEKLGGGIGLFATQNNFRSGVASSTSIGAAYNYSLRISKKLNFRAGIKGSYNTRTVDPSKLKWGIGHPPEPTKKYSDRYPDFGAGILINGDNFYAGFGADHILEPARTTDYFDISRGVYRKYVAQAGYFKKLSSDPKGYVINPYFVLHKQESVSQVWPGINLHKGLFAGGISYRAIITSPAKTHINSDAFNFLIGFNKGRFKVSYVYDYTLPDPRSAARGSHEVAMAFFLGKESLSRTALKDTEMFQRMF
ncbi:MAG: PorP/SprF family type IX secretion system membrane protein [Bacteroidia bacterium]